MFLGLLDADPDPLVRGTDPDPALVKGTDPGADPGIWIRIRIRAKMSRIPNTASSKGLPKIDLFFRVPSSKGRNLAQLMLIKFQISERCARKLTGTVKEGQDRQDAHKLYQ
jgi:hypothetical protein